MVKKTVVLCSGGIDSVGLLWQLLHETDDEIFVQHIRHKCFWNSWEYEEAAFWQAMAYMVRHCRPFTILPTMEYESEGTPEYRIRTAFNGAISVLLNDADRMVVGTVDFDVQTHTTASLRTVDIAKDVFKQVVANNKITREQPIRYFNKKDWFTLLPQDLIDRTISCRTPIFTDKWIPCNKCNSCRRYNEAASGLDALSREEWKDYRIKYKHNQKIVEMGKKSVVMFIPTLEHDNILCLWDLLVNTNKHILIQPIEIIEHDVPKEERRCLQNLINFLEDIKSKDFMILPTTKFIVGIDLTDRLRELSKSFCIGTTAWMYRNQIEEVFVTPSSNKECGTILETVIDGDVPIKEAVCEANIVLPEFLQNFLKVGRTP